LTKKEQKALEEAEFEKTMANIVLTKKEESKTEDKKDAPVVGDANAKNKKKKEKKKAKAALEVVEKKEETVVE
jgi:hypothetical protein